MDETIIVKLEEKNGDEWEPAGTLRYSVNRYPNTVNTEDEPELIALTETVRKYGEIAYAYFNTPDAMPEVNDYSEKYGVSDFAPVKNENDRLSLVLNSKLALRFYPEGLKKGATTTCIVNGDVETIHTLYAKCSENGQYYFEIAGLMPTKLATQFSVEYGENVYSFSPLSWAYLVKKNELTDRNKAMADILYEYWDTATDYAASVNE